MDKSFPGKTKCKTTLGDNQTYLTYSTRSLKEKAMRSGYQGKELSIAPRISSSARKKYAEEKARRITTREKQGEAGVELPGPLTESTCWEGDSVEKRAPRIKFVVKGQGTVNPLHAACEKGKKREAGEQPGWPR